MIDLARGVAILAMAIYHFTWDLEFFGWIASGTTLEPGWKYFARCIAASFLVLVGVSLVLAHGDQFRPRAFWVRFVQICVAAALITISTYFSTPNSFIFFGILHQIAVASLIGVLLVRLNGWLIAGIAGAVFLAANSLASPLFDPWWWRWSGLAETRPISNDYVPVFPWTGWVLMGMAAAKLGRRWIDELARFNRSSTAENRSPGQQISSALQFFGRRSLITYLLHQPALIGCVWLFTQVAGPPDRTPAFLAQCERNCETSHDKPFCVSFCQCSADEFKSASLWEDLHQGRLDMSGDPKVRAIISQCSAEPNKP